MKELTQQQLTQFHTGLVYTYTPLCGTCQVSKKMLEIVLQIEKVEHVGMVNVNYVPEQAIQWGIQSVPCLLFLREGEVIEKLYAFQSVPFLLEKIRDFKEHSHV